MKFEWDEIKNQRNILKHGVSFEDASKVFLGFTLDATDDRFDYGEERTISIGMISGIAVVTVVHTDRNGACRIISARIAKQSERDIYIEAFQKAFDA